MEWPELKDALQFITIPFLGLLAISVILSILSVLIAFKQESLAAIVYPQTIQALHSFFILLSFQLSGVAIIEFKENYPGLFSSIILFIAMGSIFCFHFFTTDLKFNFLKKFNLFTSKKQTHSSSKDKSYLLFFLLIISIVISLFASLISTEDYTNRLLRGEMLAFSSGELIAIVLFLVLFLSLFVPYRKFLFSYALDEKHYRIHLPLKKKMILLTYHLFLIVGISLSSFYFGSLFTMSILILPTFFYLTQTNSLKQYLVCIFINNFLSITLGVLLALVFDIPPVIMIVILSIVFAMIGNWVIKFLVKD